MGRIASALWLNSGVHTVHFDRPLFTDASLVHSRGAWGPRAFEIEHVADFLAEMSYTLDALRSDIESFGARVSAVLFDIWQYDVGVDASCQGSTLVNNAWGRYNHLRGLHGDRSTL